MPSSQSLELLMRVRLSTLPVHAHTTHPGMRDYDLGNEQQSDVVAMHTCPSCFSAEDTLAHFLFAYARALELCLSMYDGIRQVAGRAAKLIAGLAISDARRRVCRSQQCV